MCRLYCDTCDFGQDAKERCPKHTLLYGHVREMHQAMLSGRSWGNIVLQEEMETLANMSTEELDVLKKKKIAEEEKHMDGLKRYIIEKKQKRFCLNGKLKIKFITKCSDQGEEGGCWAHSVGACPYIHVGEEKLEEKMKAERKTKIDLIVSNPSGNAEQKPFLGRKPLRSY